MSAEPLQHHQILPRHTVEASSRSLYEITEQCKRSLRALAAEKICDSALTMTLDKGLDAYVIELKVHVLSDRELDAECLRRLRKMSDTQIAYLGMPLGW